MAKAIKFIPPQIDPLASTTTEACRKDPLHLLMQDLGVLTRMLRYIPWIIIPFRTSNKSAELYMSPAGFVDVFLNSFLFLFESVLLLVAVPAFFILPGGLFLLAASICISLILLAAWPMQGPRVAYSRMDEKTTAIAKEHKRERWIFINGCMTGRAGLQKNVDRLSQTFGRAVFGIHNNSYGLVADLLECLIQRCLSYNTRDTRVAYDYVKACALDPTITKLVLIGHSQGGIVISLILDQLFADIPPSCVSKLEIYTFGSAASHFNNPRTSLAGASPHGIIPHIEHYCNEFDMVPRWGVLYNTTEVLDNRYSGTIFVRTDATGHMFNQHYMDIMFPLQLANMADTSDQPDQALLDLDTFLDKVVDVDEKTARKRELVANRNTSLMRQQSGIEFGDGQAVPVRPLLVNGDTNRENETTPPLQLQLQHRADLDEGEAGIGFGFVNAGEAAVLGLGRDARGKTVRELSRLWMYLGGGSPKEEGREGDQ